MLAISEKWVLILAVVLFAAGCGGTVEFADGAEPGEAGDVGPTPDVGDNPDTPVDPDGGPEPDMPDPDVPIQEYNYEGDLDYEGWVGTIWPLFQGCAIPNCHGNPPGPRAQGFRLNPAPETPADHGLNLMQIEARVYHQDPPLSVIVRLGTNGHGTYQWDEAQACTIINWIYEGDGVEAPPCP